MNKWINTWIKSSLRITFFANIEIAFTWPSGFEMFSVTNVTLIMLAWVFLDKFEGMGVRAVVPFMTSAWSDYRRWNYAHRS